MSPPVGTWPFVFVDVVRVRVKLQPVSLAVTLAAERRLPGTSAGAAPDGDLQRGSWM